MRYRLYTPGPTQTPESVRAATGQPLVHHRGREFKEIFAEVVAGLQRLFQTQEEVLVLTSSGTGGMESCVANLLNPGEKALVIENGKFSQRWGELCRSFGVETLSMNLAWGESPDLDDLRKIIDNTPDLSAVLCTHSETSTGAFTDIQKVAEVVHAGSEALVIVDGITSVGVLPFFFDEWRLDAAVAGSQKGTMAPPGLAFVALSQRAWRRHQGCSQSRHYFDFTKARQAGRQNTTAWTPAVNVVLALAESLRLIHANGLESCWNHYARIASATRSGMNALGLEVFPRHPSNALTAVKIPTGIDGKQLIDILHEQYGVIVAGGQGPLKGKIFRVSHMGDYDHLDMIALMAAVEMGLAGLGWKFDWGAGLAATQKSYNKNLKGITNG